MSKFRFLVLFLGMSILPVARAEARKKTFLCPLQGLRRGHVQVTEWIYRDDRPSGGNIAVYDGKTQLATIPSSTSLSIQDVKVFCRGIAIVIDKQCYDNKCASCTEFYGECSSYCTKEFHAELHWDREKHALILDTLQEEVIHYFPRGGRTDC